MTLDEFFAALQDGRNTAANLIMGRIRIGHRCPLTLACFRVTKGAADYATCEWAYAAEAMGMDPEEARQIVRAADKEPSRLPALRAKLLDVFGLEDTDP